jgi:hypothetical protein
MNIDDFTERIEETLKEGEVKMVLEYPPGELEPEIRSNVAILGPVGHMYLLMHALKVELNAIFDFEIMDSAKKGECLEEVLEMIKEEILEEKNE